MKQDKLCSVEGCAMPYLAKKYCVKHYNSWRRKGDPIAVSLHAVRGAALAWLTTQVAIRDRTGCWVDWPFKTKASNGRPGHNIEGSLRCASHTILALDGRARPPAPGNCALHSCDEPMCLNPSHLRWGANKENTADMYARGRDTGQLTPAQVLRIRKEYTGGYGEMAYLARKLGVNFGMVQGVLKQGKWKHIVEEKGAA